MVSSKLKSNRPIYLYLSIIYIYKTYTHTVDCMVLTAEAFSPLCDCFLSPFNHLDCLFCAA